MSATSCMTCILPYVPTVHFRKYVVIENQRLWACQVTTMVVVLLVVVAALARVEVLREVQGEIRLNLWGQLGTGTELPFPASSYRYQPGGSNQTSWAFIDPSMATKCADGIVAVNETGACVNDDSLMHVGADQVFFATSFIEEIQLRRQGAECLPGLMMSQEVCTRTGSYLLPHPGNFTAMWSVDFQVQTPSSWVHMMFGLPHLQSPNLLIVLRDSEQNEIRRVSSGEVVALTVDEALQAIGKPGLDDDIQDPSSEFPDDYTTSGRPKGRVTGLDILVTVEVSNRGQDKYSHDGPIAEVDIQGRYTWNSQKIVSSLGLSGIRSRSYSGVRFYFHKNPTAQFAWFQLHEIVYSMTFWIYWLQIPFFLVFYFAIYCLGNLSDVYAGFLFENVNLHHEFNGVSTRLLEISYAFHDLHDVQEEDDKPSEWGISYDQLKKRMDVILENSKELDRKERDDFCKFLFENRKSLMKDGSEAIKLEDFLATCTNNETLLFDDIVTFADTDATQNTLEKLFTDNSLKVFGKNEQRIGHLRQKKSVKDDPVKSKHDAMMTRLQQQRDLSAFRRHSNLMQASFGLEYTSTALGKLNSAMDVLEACSKDDAEDDQIPEEAATNMKSVVTI